MRGRRPIDPEVHKLRGTYEPSRHAKRGAAAIAEGELRIAPPGLTPEQRSLWRYATAHAPKQLLTKIDRDVLRMWVETVVRFREAQRLLDSEQDPLRWANSSLHRTLGTTAALLLRLSAELGFSPMSRRGLHLPPAPKPADPNDPWEMLKLKLIPGGKGDPPELA